VAELGLNVGGCVRMETWVRFNGVCHDYKLGMHTHLLEELLVQREPGWKI
jgi:hypothetical protein